MLCFIWCLFAYSGESTIIFFLLKKKRRPSVEEKYSKGTNN